MGHGLYPLTNPNTELAVQRTRHGVFRFQVIGVYNFQLVAPKLVLITLPHITNALGILKIRDDVFELVKSYLSRTIESCTKFTTKLNAFDSKF